MQSQLPRRGSAAARLVAGAALVALVFVYVNLSATAHDAQWWQHVGLQQASGPMALQRGIRRGAHVLVRPVDPSDEVPGLVRGVDYFADYDISTVQIPRDPVGTAAKPLKFQYMNTSTAPYAFYWLSSRPRVAYIPSFLTDAECDGIVAVAAPRLKRSTLGGSDEHRVHEWRTSSQTRLAVNSSHVRPIVDRIFEQTGFTRAPEPLQILRYARTQKYNGHHDYFDPADYGPQAENRAVTVFLYLSAVEAGGETWFPGADSKPVLKADYTSCTGGLRVRPVKGSAVVFYGMTPEGGYDPWSLHAGCPVQQGTKWAGTLWLWAPTSSG